MELLSGHSQWLWAALGVLLVAGEVFVPGITLMWFGIAALVVALVDFLFPLGLFGELILFAILAGAGVFAHFKLQLGMKAQREPSEVNKGGAGYVGLVLVVAESIKDGRGSVKLGDSVWGARGADVPAGGKVRVTGIDGATLLVEPAA